MSFFSALCEKDERNPTKKVGKISQEMKEKLRGKHKYSKKY